MSLNQMTKVFYEDSGFYFDGKPVKITIKECTFNDIVRMEPMHRFDLMITDIETGENMNNFASVTYEKYITNEVRMQHIKKLIKFSNVYTREDLIEQREIRKQKILAAGREYDA